MERRSRRHAVAAGEFAHVSNTQWRPQRFTLVQTSSSKHVQNQTVASQCDQYERRPASASSVLHMCAHSGSIWSFGSSFVTVSSCGCLCACGCACDCVCACASGCAYVCCLSLCCCCCLCAHVCMCVHMCVCVGVGTVLDGSASRLDVCAGLLRPIINLNGKRLLSLVPKLSICRELC